MPPLPKSTPGGRAQNLRGGGSGGATAPTAPSATDGGRSRSGGSGGPPPVAAGASSPAPATVHALYATPTWAAAAALGARRLRELPPALSAAGDSQLRAARHRLDEEVAAPLHVIAALRRPVCFGNGGEALSHGRPVQEIVRIGGVEVMEQRCGRAAASAAGRPVDALRGSEGGGEAAGSIGSERRSGDRRGNNLRDAHTLRW